jgi:hypothetical protein
MGLATRALVQRLDAMMPEEFVTYTELETCSGVADHERLVDLLGTARSYLLKTSQKVYELIPGKGVLCHAERGKVGFGRKRRKELHTRAVKTHIFLVR